MASKRGLGSLAKARLALRVARSYVRVRSRVRRQPLPAFVAELSREASGGAEHQPPARLSRAVDRVLRVGNRQPTCLVNALVLFELLRDQGDRAELVIGLPASPADKDAHAWVELNGVDVGPPPGRSGHAEMARFG